MLVAVESPRYLTKRDYVVESLRNDILSGRLAPETPLLQEEIAQRLNLSPTPVREAFGVLETEGFLRSRPHRGVVVNRRDYGELIDLLEIRLILELSALERAIDAGNEESISALDEVVESADRVFQSGRIAALHGAAADFHTLLAAAAGSEVLSGVLRPLITRSQFYFPYSAERFAQSQREHRLIIRALRAHDADQAKRILRSHMQVNIRLLRKAAREANRPTAKAASQSREIRFGPRAHS